MTYPIDALLHARAQKDADFKTSIQSPLTPEQQHTFAGLRYFDPNPNLAFNVTPAPYPKKEPIRMLTSKNEVRSYLKWGEVALNIDGQTVTLVLYSSPGQGFFLPFMDGTTGTDSYSAGRYVEVEQAPDGTVQIDFNQAYNPYCAYNEPHSLAVAVGRMPQTWSCPLVPRENRLTVPIRAGEKNPIGDWFEQDHE